MPAVEVALRVTPSSPVMVRSPLLVDQVEALFAVIVRAEAAATETRGVTTLVPKYPVRGRVAPEAPMS